jgi:hypothetical protein
MASPHVAGGVALLKQQHPDWTVAQLKSALVQTADPVHGPNGREVSVLRQGGGLVNLPRALNPRLFASPTGVTFPVNGGSSSVTLADAGGGAGTWSVRVVTQGSGKAVNIDAPSTVSVPGELSVTTTITPSARTGTVTGFLVLSQGGDVRRIPFLVVVNRPVLGALEHRRLARPGMYEATTKGGSQRISRFRFPTGGDSSYPGPEAVFRVTIGRPVANFGVVVLSGRAVPHVVFAGDENHLVGYPGLPVTLNPYFETYGDKRSVAGAILPAAGTYDIVFDTQAASFAGPFRFRYWVNDTRPPQLRLVRSQPGTIAVGIKDGGSGVDPRSITAKVDGRTARVRFEDGMALISAAPGSHKLVLQASDFQETKNMEDVVKIKGNTSTLTRTVRVR